MKDTLNKLRNLLDMKSTLLRIASDDLRHARDTVEALRGDLEHAVSLIMRKDRQIQLLQEERYELLMKDWEQQDKDEEWLAMYLATEPEFSDGTDAEGFPGGDARMIEAEDKSFVENEEDDLDEIPF